MGEDSTQRTDGLARLCEDLVKLFGVLDGFLEENLGQA